MQYRQANRTDHAAMARLRSKAGGEEDRWLQRIAAYADYTHHPQQAREPRTLWVAIEGNILVGLIAGHLTRRLGCSGELQWLDVKEGWRNQGIGGGLLERLSEWFVAQGALKVCVNCAPDNLPARNFYRSKGAQSIDDHWMVWKDIRVLANKR
jgi:GNAT superfamily N-acetyltransferase